VKNLRDGYDDMLEHLYQWYLKMEHDTYPFLQQGLQESQLLTKELNDLTHEETSLIRDYIERDLHDAARYMHENQKELQAWLQFDLHLIEESLLHTFSFMANKTQAQLDKLTQKETLWYSNEITSIGSLQCCHCGKIVYFYKTSIIPVCPECQNTQFQRIASET
jgi:hypothetical protein